MNSKQSGRRRFLKGGAAVAGLAVGGMRSLNAQTAGPEKPEAKPNDPRGYGERSRLVTSLRANSTLNDPPHEHSWLTPLQDSVGIITPSGLHFWEDHGYSIPLPEQDPQKFRLIIHGMVDRPLEFSVKDLKRLPSVSRIHFLECNANSRPQNGPHGNSLQHVHGKTSCSEWTGVLVSLLLKEAGLQSGGTWLVTEGADPGKYTTSIPVSKALEDCLVAYGQNGEPVRPEQGFPLRMIVPGWQGHNQVKWLRRIKVVDQPYMAKWESGSNTDEWPDGKGRWYRFEMGPKSLITHPCPENRLPGRGFYEITGLAWSGGGAIRKVEVSTDGGRTWKEAQLQNPVHRMAHTRFRLDWNWDGEEVVLQSRCTDERGEVQPTIAELGKIKGVAPDKLQSYFVFPFNRVDHVNAIQPWRVNKDGSVQNALFA